MSDKHPGYGLSPIVELARLQTENADLRRQVEQLRRHLDEAPTLAGKMLHEAAKIIRTWHGQGMPRWAEERAWALYWDQSPEMHRLRECAARLAVLGAEKPVKKERTT